MSDEELLEFMEEEGGGTYTAKSVVLDMLDNYGFTNAGLFEMDFYLAGAKLPLVQADQEATGYTTFLSVQRLPKYAFDSSLSVIGSSNVKSHLSGTGFNTNQRIWVKFNTPIVFDAIVINNWHESGNTTTVGFKNVVVQITEDTTNPVTVYEAAVTDGVTVFDGVFPEHAPTNTVQDFQLTLI